MTAMLILVICAAAGVFTAHLAISTIMDRYDTAQDRAAALLRHVYFDIAIFAFLFFMGAFNTIAFFFVPKYIFLSIINFQKTLEQ